MAILHLLAYGEMGGTEILCKNYLNYSNNKNVVAFVWGMGVIADEIKNNGHNCYNLECGHFDIIKMLKKVEDICDKENIETIVCHHSIAAMHLLLIILKKKRPNIKMIFYAQCNAKRMCSANHKVLEPIQKAIIKRFYKSADEVIAISKNVRDSLISTFGKKGRDIVVIYNGIVLDNYRYDEKKNNIPQIIYVGRLIKDKGVQFIIEGLSRIDLEYRFTIVGDGEYRDSLEKLVNQFGINDKVVFLGLRKDIPELLAKADYFLHIPLCEEGFGLTIVEAMASGLVCICGNRGAIPEIITDGVDGIICGYDPNKIKKIIEKTINAKGTDLDLQMRINARRRSENFSIITYSQKLDNLVCARNK